MARQKYCLGGSKGFLLKFLVLARTPVAVTDFFVAEQRFRKDAVGRRATDGGHGSLSEPEKQSSLRFWWAGCWVDILVES
jgi:hypothetical protein